MGAVLDVELWQHASALDAAENRAALDLITEQTRADLVVLPEAFARDFGDPGSSLAPYAEPLDGPFVGALRAASQRSGAAVVGGMFETSDDPDRPFNTLVLAQGDQLTTYRKIHLYDSFGQRESDVVMPGPLDPVVADVAGARVGLLTCYDLRFPELARALSAQGVDVLVLPAAWVAGERKVEHWRTLLRARAIENLCWVVAAAQPGPRYCGHSLVIAPTGDVVAEGGEGEEWITATLELDQVADTRRQNPSLQNRRL
ncbi:putative amidohydrolase [Marmoricola sp. OAE513]|uniref:carbon-nitrogen hydrolase family protein n=1 Tax=Marmoricola sp. OAE513 TaxID=2817894 RepID=UPI001DFAEB58